MSTLKFDGSVTPVERPFPLDLPPWTYASTTARKRGMDNQPPPSTWDALRRLVAAVTTLQAAAARLGSAFIVTSAYRSPLVNAAVGGHVRSKHLVGRAVDVLPPAGLSLERAAVLARACGFSVVLVERSWLHLEVGDG